MFLQYVIHNSSSRDWGDVSFFELTGPEDTFSNIFSYALIPIVSLTGISGNLISMRILHQHGLRKSSNVLIFALALADTIYLVGVNNVAMFIYLGAHRGSYGFFLPEGVALFLYVLFHAFVLLETVGKVMSMLLPTLIIAERLVAVFWPLQFSRLLTARRVQMTTAVMYLLAVPPFALYARLTDFVYYTSNTTDLSAGLVVRSPTFYTAIREFEVMSEVYSIVCGPVSVGVVVIGCALIGVKIHLQLRHRQKMTSQGGTKSAANRSRKVVLTSFSLKRARSYHVAGTVLTSFRKIYIPETPKQEACPPTMGRHVQFCTDAASASPTDAHSNNNFQRPQPSHFEDPPAKPSSQRHQVRTTKILLSVCVVYSITAALSSLSDLVLNSRRISYLTAVKLHRGAILAMCVNSSANFIIYVAMNRNFRATYRQMCCMCLGHRGLPEFLSRTF